MEIQWAEQVLPFPSISVIYKPGEARQEPNQTKPTNQTSKVWGMQAADVITTHAAYILSFYLQMWPDVVLYFVCIVK